MTIDEGNGRRPAATGDVPTAMEVTRSAGPAALLRIASVRATEILLIVLGVGFLTTADDLGVWFLVWWNVVAFVYIVVGAVVLRRSRRGTRVLNRHPWTGRLRITFLMVTMVSLTGLGAAIDVAWGDAEQLTEEQQFWHAITGTIAMLLAWVLLHSAYARWYAGHYDRIGGGLRFPETEVPGPVDFLYFAMTIGTAFSASDTLVTTTEMRWHVLVHQVVAFFFNAAVLAFAIGILR
ncbi:DUF1345 domain-containing protein [Nakamurella flava]|uniref:DUF1345 domain-containing protein n=1 Tax=Nakamurella flava TaxID=2576308 RepID=A0A4U6Q8V2_9ACTN|nr:DUF1345 domain-containing protein [Nakamurella flava]TKV56302.1 DUF1345 domain-containing protein [Nakamurella flava]